MGSLSLCLRSFAFRAAPDTSDEMIQNAPNTQHICRALNQPDFREVALFRGVQDVNESPITYLFIEVTYKELGELFYPF